MDGRFNNASINLHAESVYSTNIISLFRKYGVPSPPDYISVDIDSADLWIMRSILASEYAPRLLQVEYNCAFPWGYPLTFADPSTMGDIAVHHSWDGRTCFFGASVNALVLAAAELDYVVDAFTWFVDLYFMPKSLARQHGLESIQPQLEANEHLCTGAQGSPAYNSGGRTAMKPERANELLDYSAYARAPQEQKVKHASQSAATMLAELGRLAGNKSNGLGCFKHLGKSLNLKR